MLELFIDLGASDDQLECPFVYASAKAGVAVLDLSDEKQDMKPLFETILDYIPAPEGDPEAPTQMLISTIDYNEYVGRIGVGKVENGTIAVNQDIDLNTIIMNSGILGKDCDSTLTLDIIRVHDTFFYFLILTEYTTLF